MKQIILPLFIFATISMKGQSVEFVNAKDSVSVISSVPLTELHFGVKNITSDSVYMIATREIGV